MLKLRDEQRQPRMGLYDFLCGARKVGGAMYFRQPHSYDVFLTVRGRRYRASDRTLSLVQKRIREAARAVRCGQRSR